MGIPISNVQELQDIQDNLSGDYYLTQNIDASETRTWDSSKGFEPIGDYNNPFTGRFDGNEYVIKNLYIGRDSTNYVGLFGHTGSGAIIENVELRNENIHGGERTGGLVGQNENARVSNSRVTGKVQGSSCVGGLVGYNFDNARVTNCYSTGEVHGSDDAGGLIGYNEDTRVDNSFWDVETSGQSSSAGGTGKTTIEMKTKSTFTDAGWNFTDTWHMDTEVITLNMGSISPGQSASVSKTFTAPLYSGKTYLVEVTAFDSENNAILRETTTVIAGR